jgi:hypothetical protein
VKSGPAALSSRENDGEPYFEGRYDYAKPGRFRTFVASAAVLAASVVACTFCVAIPEIDVRLRAGVLVLLVVLLAVLWSFAASAWRSHMGTVERLKIAASGIAVGNRRWNWAEIEQIRFRMFDAQNCRACVEVRPARLPLRLGQTIVFLLDEPLSRHDCENLVTRVRQRLQQLGAHTSCDIS